MELNLPVIHVSVAGPDFPGKEGALRVSEEQTVAHQTEDTGIRQSHGVERRIQLKLELLSAAERLQWWTWD